MAHPDKLGPDNAATMVATVIIIFLEIIGVFQSSAVASITNEERDVKVITGGRRCVYSGGPSANCCFRRSVSSSVQPDGAVTATHASM